VSRRPPGRRASVQLLICKAVTSLHGELSRSCSGEAAKFPKDLEVVAENNAPRLLGDLRSATRRLNLSKPPSRQSAGQPKFIRNWVCPCHL
jgi:hypothetical protein